MYLKRFTTLSVPLSALGALVFPPTTLLAQQDRAVVLDSAFLAGYRWRNLGPDRGGRSIAVTGVRGRPDEGYFGAVGGGPRGDASWITPVVAEPLRASRGLTSPRTALGVL